MAIRRLSRTMMLMSEKLPNMMRPQNRVNSLMPRSSKLSRSIRPKAAQKRVWDVSHKLRQKTSKECCWSFLSVAQARKFPAKKWSVSIRLHKIQTLISIFLIINIS